MATATSPLHYWKFGPRFEVGVTQIRSDRAECE